MKKLNYQADYGSTAIEVGESYRTILGYFIPEYITCLILYCMLGLFDSLFIAQLPGQAYTTLGYTNTLFHLLTKLAEAFSVGMVIICGSYNGRQEYSKVGKAVTSGFWATLITGALLSSIIYLCAHAIYVFYQVPDDMVALGVPFIRLRAIGIFLQFAFFALIGFLRGIKNTKTPMHLMLVGGALFIVVDYVLLFGAAGFPALGLQGSAIASIVHYAVMLIGALGYLMYNLELRKYSIALLSKVDMHEVAQLMKLSWPVMLDKAALAVCQIWLSKQMSVVALAQNDHMLRACYVAIKDIERFAIIPALAFAQIITFLVSNDYRLGNFAGIRANVLKVLLLSCVFVGGLLLMVAIAPGSILSYINADPAFIRFVAACIPVVSLLVIFDITQLIISAAFRGASKVHIVMVSRIAVSALFFVPISYLFAHMHFASGLSHFIAVYSTIYIANGITSGVYLYWLKQVSYMQSINSMKESKVC